MVHDGLTPSISNFSSNYCGSGIFSACDAQATVCSCSGVVGWWSGHTSKTPWVRKDVTVSGNRKIELGTPSTHLGVVKRFLPVRSISSTSVPVSPGSRFAYF